MAAAFPKWVPDDLHEQDKHRVLYGERQAVSSCDTIVHDDVVTFLPPKANRPGRPENLPDLEEIAAEAEAAARDAGRDAARSAYREVVLRKLRVKKKGPAGEGGAS